MESIKKLREVIGADVSQLGYTNGTKKLHELVDEIEREIAERYMELPTDRNGEVVHIGDELYYEGYNQQFKVGCINIQYAHIYVKDAPNGDTWKPEECVHVKQRTIEDVLQDYAYDYMEWYEGHSPTNKKHDEIIEKYAAEIRGLL